MDHIQRYAVALAIIGIIAELVLIVRRGKVPELFGLLAAIAIQVPVYGRVWGWW